MQIKKRWMTSVLATADTAAGTPLPWTRGATRKIRAGNRQGPAKRQRQA